MSAEDVSKLEETLNALEARVFAKIGRWVAGILASCLALGAVAATQWANQVSRIDKLETWKVERTKPIEEYYQDQKNIAERLSAIETKLALIADRVLKETH